MVELLRRFYGMKKMTKAKSGSEFVKAAAPGSVELTVYQQGGVAVVREKRIVSLTKGGNRLLLEGMPARFMPNSLRVLSATGSGEFRSGTVSYRAANLDWQRVLNGSLNKRVCVRDFNNSGRQISIPGMLRAVLGNMLAVQRDDNQRVMLVQLNQVELLEGMPQGLSATPSLVMSPDVSASGDYEVELMYESGGFGWAALYSAYYDEQRGVLRKLDCAVSLTSTSGARHESASVRLMTGANHKQVLPHGGYVEAAVAGGGYRNAPMVDDVAPVDVGEAKCYPLPGRVDLAENDSQQSMLFSATEVPVQRQYFVPAGNGYWYATGTVEKLPVNVRLIGRNSKSSRLGQSMPGGDVDIFHYDNHGVPRKTSTVSFPAVSEDEEFRLEYGPAADLKVERRLVSVEESQDGPIYMDQPPQLLKPLVGCAGAPGLGTPGHAAELRERILEGVSDMHRAVLPPKHKYRVEERELTVHNYRGEAVDVLVQESLPATAEISVQPQGLMLTRENALSASLKLSVPAKGKRTLKYSVKIKMD
ncbi:MAG: DUF4139 domain-containing protein [Candidatus Obscuribacterales bacterium]|nr:DUF4139 domain-containing protein [Candidatus Obscuribacterales bacterium]